MSDQPLTNPENQTQVPKPYSHSLTIWAVLIVIVTAILIWLNLNQYEAQHSKSTSSEQVSGEQTVRELTPEEIGVLNETFTAIQALHIGDNKAEDLVTGALKGMVHATEDPYSEYLNQSETEDFDQSIEGSFPGIGVQIMSESGLIRIVSPIEGTPAARANLQPNDYILEADGVDLKDMSTTEVVDLIRGPVGDPVTLKIQRGSSTFEVEIIREEIPIITVEGELLADHPGLGHLKITQFNGTTYDELVNQIKELRQQGAKGFIFDLRYNPGGLLDQAMLITNMFLEDGQVMMQMENKLGQQDQFIADQKEYGNFKVTEPYLLLVNQGSASASEVLASAIRDNTSAQIVGQTTFGKGTVQSIISESDLGELKLTTAKWLTPKGDWIHEKGLEPDLEVEPNDIDQAILLNAEEKVQAGDSTEYVRTIALVLKALGYTIDSEHYFNETMTTAVKAFQKDHQLTEDGLVTGETATALNQAARDYIQAHDAQLEAAADQFAKELTPGAEAESESTEEAETMDEAA